MLTPATAKKMLKAELDRLALPYTKLTAKTVSFTDLARTDSIFVTIHGWKPNPIFDDLKAFARTHGFIIQA